MRASKENKTKVLQFLADNEQQGYLFHKAYIAKETGLSVAATLMALRALKKEGIVYTDTMFSEDDGLIMGVGWSIKYGADASQYPLNKIL